MTTMTATDPSPDRSLAMRMMRSAVATIPSTQYGKRAVTMTAAIWRVASALMTTALETVSAPCLATYSGSAITMPI